jgi:pimeloyl-ACP methyl ester carboxylesterase
MPRLRVGNVELHHEVRGEGPPILFIMGWRANLDWWPPEMMASLAQHHQLILFDNRGAGRTGDPGGAVSMEKMADDAAALLAALGHARADVCGVSMGGMIAQELALRHPEVVDRLVLISTHCGKRGAPPTEDMRRARRRAMLRPWKIEENLAYMLFSRDLPVEDPQRWAEFVKVVQGAPASAWASVKQFRAIMKHDTWDRLPSIGAKTLVMTGDRDLMVAPGNADILASRIPRARLVKLAGASHAILRDRVSEVTGLVGDFLAA